MGCGSSTNTVSPAKDSSLSHTDIKIHAHRHQKTLENIEQKEQHAQIEDIVQNFFLVWLDNHLDESKEDFHNSFTKLQRTIDVIEKFRDANECITHISRSENKKIFLVVSGKLTNDVVPLMHDKSQIYAIYIFCFDKSKYEQWTTEKWPKVRGIFANIDSICDSLRQTARECDDDDMKITGQIEPSFMYSMLFKEIVLEIHFDLEKEIPGLAKYARQVYKDKPEQLPIIDEFVQQYNGNINNSPVRWYTAECFTYKMLNKALGRLDAATLLKTGFFMRDLHQNIEELHEKQINDNNAPFPKTVYRGKIMTQEDFKNKIQQGKLISYNNFLSTTEKRDVAIDFIGREFQPSDSKIAVLFIMTIDPSVKSAPYARISEFSKYPEEQEILFSTHSVFRVRQIQETKERGMNIQQVNLTLTSEKNDNELSELTESIRKDIEGNGWERMGLLLWKINQNDKAEEIYTLLLQQATSDGDKAYCYNQLGLIKRDQGDYKQALDFYEKSIKIKQTILPDDDPNLAMSYNNIALVYKNMGDYSKALEFYEKDLEITKKALPSNHPHLATSYNNIGGVHKNIGDYSKALEFYEKALTIREKALPSNHPDLATSYNNIGQVCNNMGDYSIALEFYEKALKIKEKALPPNHPSLAGSHLNFAVCYERMGDYASALKALQNALQIQQKAFQECNPAFTSTYSWFGRVYRSMKDYSKALGYFEKCLAIDLKTLAEGHPYQAITYSNIGDVYRLMGNYEKALAFHQKALDIQENVHCNPLQCAATYTNLGETYRKMQDYSTALSYFQKGLEIREKKLPKSHPDLAVIYHNMAKLYLSTGQYNMAMKNVQQAIEIAQEKLHSTHPHLLEYKETFEKIRKEM
ncbi:unnamed protein product [Rotaria sp. Silwood1]|nr:unnamed protein product [Rotaria sp. Silwood1]CAF4912128.1 unnamed protein product [Rotaria sp. Silwood1]